jgi:hypothetical protein
VKKEYSRHAMPRNIFSIYAYTLTARQRSNVERAKPEEYARFLPGIFQPVDSALS